MFQKLQLQANNKVQLRDSKVCNTALQSVQRFLPYTKPFFSFTLLDVCIFFVQAVLQALRSLFSAAFMLVVAA